MPISGSLDSILVLLKSVLIFHRWGFYGTDSIHEKSDGLDLIFQVQMFVTCEEEEPCWRRQHYGLMSVT